MTTKKRPSRAKQAAKAETAAGTPTTKTPDLMPVKEHEELTAAAHKEIAGLTEKVRILEHKNAILRQIVAQMRGQIPEEADA